MIVDAHAHIFQDIHGFSGGQSTSGLGYGKVHNGVSAIQFMPPLSETTIHSCEMLIAQMDWAEVAKAVLLQGPFYGDNNDYVLDAVRQYPDRLIAMAYLDPWEKDVQRHYAQLFENKEFAGVKLECSALTGLMSKHKHVRLESSELDWLWDDLQKRRLTLALDLGKIGSSSYQTKAIRHIATRHPELKIVIAHLGQPGPQMMIQQDLKSCWAEQIDLGLLTNVWFDTSALPHYFPDEQFPFPTAARLIREVIEKVGPDKVLWGTDVPGLLTVVTYPQLVYMAESHLHFLNPADKAKVLGGNAMKVYG